jgi:very-short-patch-repair endonuclease
MDLRPARELIRRQDGVATFQQLEAAGISRGAVRAQLEAVRWRRHGDRTVLAHNHVPTRRQLMWIAVLDPTGCVCLGGLTALETAGFRFFGNELELVHVVVQRGAKTWSHPQLKVHESRRLHPADLDPASPLPRTRLPRSALDAAAWQPFPRYACALLAGVVQQRLCTVRELQDELRFVGRIRHKQHMRLALQDIAGGSEALSELDLVALCRRFSLPVPDRQVRRQDASGRTRYLDAEWRLPRGRVVLEVDGAHHMTAAHWESDIRRERQVVADGSLVLRATANEIRLEPAAVVRDLRAVGVTRH